jgi:hypothetical protein
MPAPNVEEVQVPCSLFLGLNTEVAPPDLPEGVSPACQDVAFVPGNVFSRPCLHKLFSAPFPGNPTVTYQETFAQPNADPLNLYMTSDGKVWTEDVLNAPGACAQLAQIIDGLQAESVTASGAEYLAFSNGLQGMDVPRQVYRTPDGTLQFDRVSQDGPGANPLTVTDRQTAIAITFSGLNANTGFLMAVDAASEVGNICTLDFLSGHNFIPGQPIVVFGVNGGGGYNGNFTVLSITPTSISYYNPTTGLGSGNTGFVNLAVAICTTSAPHGLNNGDFCVIAGATPASGGFNPNNSGTAQSFAGDVDTDSTGTIVSWVSGTLFDDSLNDQPITINGAKATVAVVTSPTSLILTGQVTANQSGVSYAATSLNPVNWQVVEVIDDENFLFSVADSTQVLSSGSNAAGGTLNAGGQSTVGVHQVVLMFLTRSGYLTQPSPPISFVTAGNTQWVINNIPIGPPNVVARVFAFTGAGGDNFFTITSSLKFPNPSGLLNAPIVIEATTVNDNTSTSAVIDVSDNALFGAQGIDIDGNDLFNQVVLGPCLFFFYYASRLIAAGMSNKLENFLNMGFEGGYPSGDLAAPLGWTVENPGGALVNEVFGSTNLTSLQFAIVAGPAPGTAFLNISPPSGTISVGSLVSIDTGANQETVTVLQVYIQPLNGVGPGTVVIDFTAVFTKNHAANAPIALVSYGASSAVGQAWQITGDGSPNRKGEITQPCYQNAYGVAIVEPSTQYNARFFAVASAGATGTLYFDLYSPTAGLLARATENIASIAAGGPGFYEDMCSAVLPAAIPADAVLDIYAIGLQSGATVTIDEIEIIPTYDPYFSSFLVSYVDNFEAFDGVSGVMGPTSDPNPLRGCETIRDQLQFLTSGGMHQTSDNGEEPSSWTVSEISNDTGLAAFRALDAGEECIIFVSKSGGGNGTKPTYALRIYEGGQPWKISQEVQTIFDQINPAAESTMWLVNDIGQCRIYIGVPTGNATAPNQIYVLDYREIDTAYQIAQAPSIHISFTGKMIASDLARKWCPWNIQANCGAMLARPGGNTQFCLGAGNGVTPGNEAGFGNVYYLDPLKYTDDDYGVMSPFYVMYFFLSRDTESALGVGSMRKLYKGLSEFISGIGNLTITPYAASLTNPWPGPPPVELSAAPTADFYHGLNVSTERMAVKFAVSPLEGETDVQFNLQHMAARIQQHPMSPSGTGATI